MWYIFFLCMCDIMYSTCPPPLYLSHIHMYTSLFDQIILECKHIQSSPPCDFISLCCTFAPFRFLGSNKDLGDHSHLVVIHPLISPP
jgi:hypothetical protein